MNPSIITLDPTISPILTKTVLAKDGFQCAVLTLPPGAETPLRESTDVAEHLLYAVAGEATVRCGDLNLMLNQDDALLIPQGQAHRIVAGAQSGAKILRVDVPPRQVVTPQILTVQP